MTVEKFDARLVEADRGGAFVKLPPDVVDGRARTVTVPDDLRSALKKSKRDKLFGALSYSHQREYVSWIDEAKKPETRARRIAQTVERLA